MYMETLQIDDERLELAVHAAEKAGEAAASVKYTTPQERKGNGTVVTEADREAEQIVRDILTANSDLPLLGEEQGGDIEDEDSYWVIDPIDGTKNFSYQQPLYGTAVALVEDNDVTVGVFYMPDIEYLFYAVEGNGAYRNTEQLSVSTEDDVSESYIMLSGKGRTEIQPSVSELNDWNQQLGSAVMGEGWVASGWCDVAVYGALAPWDIAVGKILIEEAGGVMKTVAKGESSWNAVSDGRVVFGNEVVVDSMLADLPTEARQAVKESTYDY